MKHPNDILYWLAAIKLKGIGPVRIQRWLGIFSHLKNLFTASKNDLLQAGLTAKEIDAIKNPDWRTIEKDLQWCEKNNCDVMTYQDENYPELLKEIYDAPLILFLKGNKDLLHQRQLAMVGSRNPSALGKENAKRFSFSLAEAGLVITSGLALGIDTACHAGALAAHGNTIAVLGTGLEIVYPKSNVSLANEIAEKGLLISEFSPFTPPRATHFPLRNRVISGLSLGVFVVEAALRSGSLITARMATEQGRDVFAMPGSIHNPLARGCHYLIRQGAKLVESAEDIIEEIVGIRSEPFKKCPDEIDTTHCVLSQIGYEITPLDVIIDRSGLTQSEVCSMLLSLELAGYVSRVTGGYIRNPCNNK